jgi:hypothetical protein
MADLPIVKMTLYKHGVGFYQRRGAVEGDSITLIFRKEEMNDVLKSLTAFTRDGGQVLNVDYETPEDKAVRLARSSIQLSDQASLRDLLRDLRGRQVAVDTEAGALEGTVVGVDLPSEREPMAAAMLSIFVASRATVQPVRLADLRTLRLVDARAAGDLAFFLDASLADEEKRALTVRLSKGPSDLVLSYIGPSPTWRVSYRLVAEEAEDKSEGLLQGWGLFDNTLDEDLENVQISLVAGMPVSFIYDLYNPFTPERPVVQEQARTVAGPVEMAQAMEAMPEGMAVGAGLGPARMRAVKEMAAPAYARLSAADMAESMAVAATGQAQGELFSYAITNPVTVRRGRSAMVPILQKPVAYHKERIYSTAKQRTNPIVTARFKNDTGLTLERGPVTVIEAGEYAGEAMLPFTGTGTEVYLAFAIDLGVKVSEETSTEQVATAVNIEKGLLVVQEYHVQRTKYRVENNNDAAVEVTIEHPKLANYDPFETTAPKEVTASAYRYSVTTGAHGVVTFTAAQRRSVLRREEIRSQQLEQLRQWLRDRILDESAFKALQKVLALYERISEHEAKIKENEGRRKEIHAEQKVIQGNLGALRDQGEEAQLRARYVQSLNEQENQLAQLKGDDDGHRKAIEGTRKEIEELLTGF